MSQQYFMLTTIKRVRLPNTSILGFMLSKRIQDHTISLEHISAKKMLTNPLMKDLPPNVFREHLANMGLRESL
jgi:hypothetical protein